MPGIRKLTHRADQMVGDGPPKGEGRIGPGHSSLRTKTHQQLTLRTTLLAGSVRIECHQDPMRGKPEGAGFRKFENLAGWLHFSKSPRRQDGTELIDLFL